MHEAELSAARVADSVVSSTDTALSTLSANVGWLIDEVEKLGSALRPILTPDSPPRDGAATLSEVRDRTPSMVRSAIEEQAQRVSEAAANLAEIRSRVDV